MSDDLDAKDRDVRDAMMDDRKVQKPKASEANRRRERVRMMKLLEKAFKEKNERGISDALRHGGIVEGSDEWKKVWQSYRTYCGY
jgi:hypothetical protein